MEYEFSQDLLGAPVARFSMGHEAFAVWLEDELVAQPARLAELLTQLDQLQQGRGWDFELDGREYSLFLDRDDAFVGMRSFGASGPAPDLYRHFGITAEVVTRDPRIGR